MLVAGSWALAWACVLWLVPVLAVGLTSGNPEHQARIREMAGKAREMGKTTIAEFVQDAGSMSILFGAGVDYAQGHFLAASSPNMDYEF